MGETIRNHSTFELQTTKHMQQIWKYEKKTRRITQYKNRHFWNKEELKDSFSLQTKSLK